MNWISVETELPPAFTDVLAYNPNMIVGQLGIASWIQRDDFEDGEFWCFNGVSGGGAEKIARLKPTHWQRLPEPPQPPE